MQTSSYIDPNTREAVRARAISYIESDVPQGRTLHEYARTVSRTRRSSFVLRRLAGRSGSASSRETTAGGW